MSVETYVEKVNKKILNFLLLDGEDEKFYRIEYNNISNPIQKTLRMLQLKERAKLFHIKPLENFLFFERRYWVTIQYLKFWIHFYIDIVNHKLYLETTFEDKNSKLLEILSIEEFLDSWKDFERVLPQILNKIPTT